MLLFLCPKFVMVIAEVLGMSTFFACGLVFDFPLYMQG